MCSAAATVGVVLCLGSSLTPFWFYFISHLMVQVFKFPSPVLNTNVSVLSFFHFFISFFSQQILISHHHCNGFITFVLLLSTVMRMIFSQDLVKKVYLVSVFYLTLVRILVIFILFSSYRKCEWIETHCLPVSVLWI